MSTLTDRMRAGLKVAAIVGVVYALVEVSRREQMRQLGIHARTQQARMILR